MVVKFGEGFGLGFELESSESEIVENSEVTTIKEKTKIILLDARYVKTVEDYNRLLKSGELKKYILEEIAEK